MALLRLLSLSLSSLPNQTHFSLQYLHLEILKGLMKGRLMGKGLVGKGQMGKGPIGNEAEGPPG